MHRRKVPSFFFTETTFDAHGLSAGSNSLLSTSRYLVIDFIQVCPRMSPQWLPDGYMISCVNRVFGQRHAPHIECIG